MKKKHKKKIKKKKERRRKKNIKKIKKIGIVIFFILKPSFIYLFTGLFLIVLDINIIIDLVKNGCKADIKKIPSYILKSYSITLLFIEIIK